MTREPTKAAVLGGDVSRSRSPAIHLAAFAALGIEGRYQAISVDARSFRGAVRQLAGNGYRYVNVTIPHKRAAAAMADVASPLVRATRAANTLIFRHARSARGTRPAIHADNTDGYGLVTALSDLGVTPARGQTYVLVGAGGAAAGAVAALIAAGADVRLVARRTAAAHALRRLFPANQRSHIEVFAWAIGRGERRQNLDGLELALEGADVLVSAVPADAWHAPAARAGLRALARQAAVLEMAYGAPTPLAAEARARVARYQDGIPMLVHQAARAVQLALGHLPPAQPLLRAARTGSN